MTGYYLCHAYLKPKNPRWTCQHFLGHSLVHADTFDKAIYIATEWWERRYQVEPNSVSVDCRSWSPDNKEDLSTLSMKDLEW